MLLLIAAHLVAALVAPLLVRWWGTRAFLALALVPSAGVVWLAANLTTIRGAGAVTESGAWIPTLGLDLDLRVDALSAVMVALVTGVGALVLVYCRWYFTASSEGLGRFAFAFLGFAGSMLGLVVADNMLLLYVFWELTTLFSYLLIGQYFGLRTSRRAAMEALIVTTTGGLAMLVGFILLGVTTGSYELSYVVAHPPDGTVAVVAAVLILLGALSKSAIVPFHFWLPAAMAAPTPVSAYLHAAAMVKGGVFLVARMSPGFADLPVWRWSLLVLGAAALLNGAWVALRQHDLKLLLAYGTVSQLGLLMLVYGIGTSDAALAGTALLAAHALYKSTLFLVVGVVEHDNGTRDLRALSGVGRRTPWLAAVAGLAVASMMGIPPLLGFVAKEAMYGAALAAPFDSAVAETALLVVLVVGTALTVAYGVRFLVGAFGTRELVPGTTPHQVHRSPRPVLLAPATLSLLGLAGGLTVDWWAPLVEQYATTVPGTLTVGLTLWHGVSGALGLSVLGLVLGAVVALWLGRTGPRAALLPEKWEAQWRYRRLMRGLDRLAVETTAATQRGSLPFYLGTSVVVLSLLLVVALTRVTWPQDWQLWDSPTQAWVALLAIPLVVAATRVRQRLTAVLLVGATGYAMVVIFVVQGAPDLALTQALVETCTLVVFVLVLRKLPKQIQKRDTGRQELRRLLIAVPAGILFAVGGAVALSARTASSVSEQFPGPAYDFGGGVNIVNVILVDIRAWDTFGEISVLIAAATGVASLIFLERRTGGPPQLDESSRRDPIPQDRMFLRGGLAVRAENRSVVLEVTTRALFPTMVVLSLYLLFAGHNVPGGGFAGGLVAGLALVLRYLAAGRYELGEAAPVEAGVVLGTGLLLAGVTGAAALLVGGDVFQSTIAQFSLPLFGDVKIVTALFFDIGVYLVVVGLVLDILRSLGAELDRRDEDDDVPAEVSS